MIEQKGKNSLQVHHVCIVSSDYKKAVEFYVHYLGLELYRESFSDSRNAVKLELYSAGRYVVELFAPEEKPSLKSKPIKQSKEDAVGLDHLSFTTNDVQAVIQRMKLYKVPVSGIKLDKSTGKRYAFCWDADGTKIEFYEK